MAMKSGGEAAGSGKKSADGGFVELVKTLIQAVLIAVVLRTVLIQPFNIPSGSLIPTLLVGDYVFVTKYSYGFSKYSIPFAPNLFSGRIWGSEPKRGEIAVFRQPVNKTDDFIKRVIGLPGDRIQMIGGILHINGEAVKREPAGMMTIRNGYGQTYDAPLYTETLPGGVSHTILETEGDDGQMDNTEVYTVPPGNYFMMGDNRDGSEDSRYLAQVGYVPLENFLGKAQIVFFSIEGDSSALAFWNWPWTLRLSRIFTWIR